MTADHLTARQLAYSPLAQHPLTDTSSGLYWRSSDDWAAAAAAGHYLPRHGKVGAFFNDSGVTLSHSTYSSTSNGLTIECVYTNSNTSYNFFGGQWPRWPIHYYGNEFGQYAVRYCLELYPVNDLITDTQGRIRALVSDVGGTWIASTTVHSRPVVSDGLPHHICMTHEGSPTLTNAVKVYVDGVLTETSTLNSGRPLTTLYANKIGVGADDIYVHPNGSVSHACVTAQVLPLAEIKARANLVNKGVGSRFTDAGNVMAWDATNNTWTPAVVSRSGSNWKPVIGYDV